eukprot:g17996.t1
MAKKASIFCLILMLASVVLPQGLVLARGTVADDPKPPIAGGWTSSRPPTADDMEVWKEVVTSVNKDLSSFGQPTEVSSQVVAGIKNLGRQSAYKFGFPNGGEVTVYSVPWLKKLEVTQVKDGTS